MIDTFSFLAQRERNHGLNHGSTLSPDLVVSRAHSLQAQDYAASLWAIGIRSRPGTTFRDVENCLKEGSIIRKWLNRGTIHITHRKHARNMMGTLLPLLSGLGKYRDGHLGITEEKFASVKNLFRKALDREKTMTRGSLYGLLKESGIVDMGQNMGYHLLYRASWDQLICFGPPANGEQTFVLVDHWIPGGRGPVGDDGISAIISAYVASHGPVTLQDIVWWSGLKASDVRDGISSLCKGIRKLSYDGEEYYVSDEGSKCSRNDLGVHLLPAFDEYVLGYRNRKILFPNGGEDRVVRKNGIFTPTVISGGVVAGTWKARQSRSSLDVSVELLEGSEVDNSLIKEAAYLYGAFMQSDLRVRIG